MWRCFVRDQARVPSVAGAVAPFFVTGTVFFDFLPGSAGGVVAARVATRLSPSFLRAQRAIFFGRRAVLTIFEPFVEPWRGRLTLT